MSPWTDRLDLALRRVDGPEVAASRWAVRRGATKEVRGLEAPEVSDKALGPTLVLRRPQEPSGGNVGRELCAAQRRRYERKLRGVGGDGGRRGLGPNDAEQRRAQRARHVVHELPQQHLDQVLHST